MKILVTGATGFVGRALCRELARQGHSIRTMVRVASVDKIDPSSGYEVMTGDILDTHACLRAADGVEAFLREGVSRARVRYFYHFPRCGWV